MYVCKHCQEKAFEKILSTRSHELRCKSNPNRYVPVPPVVSPAERREIGKRLSEKYASGELVQHGTKHTDEAKKRIADYAKQHHGGYREGSGRGKKGRYKGIYCDSSWELAYLLYCESQGVVVVRNTEKFPYQFGGKTKRYIPDFIVDGKYIEVKGYESDEWEAKRKCFPHDLQVLAKNEIKPIIEFVTKMHGKDFVRLYD